MKIEYCCTHWGNEDKTLDHFFSDLLKESYSGVEINLPVNSRFDFLLYEKIQKLKSKGNFKFIAQQVLEQKNESAEAYCKRLIERLEYLIIFQPDAINSHTGKDFFSFDDNCRIIETVEKYSIRHNIPIFHETHRGRFSFHLQTLLPYLEKFPSIKLTADFSHWCNVSESMLQGQEDALNLVIPHIRHLHARVGFEQSAQVNNPFAPEWAKHLNIFINWWQNILNYHINSGLETFSITPEYGPFPYMPTMPFTQEPVANPWKINAKMKTYLQNQLKLTKQCEPYL